MAQNIGLTLGVALDQTDLNNATRDIIRRARQLDTAFNKLGPGGLTTIQKSLKSSALTLADLNDRANRATQSLTELGNRAKLTAQRFIVYNIIAGIFFRLSAAISDGVRGFLDFDAAVNRAKQILNPFISNIEDLQKITFQLGEEFGLSISKIQEAQEIFIRAGKTQVETIQLTKAALALSTTSSIDAAEATEGLISALNQYNLTADKAIQITDKLTAVSINFAVEANDLDQAIRRTGSAANTVGVNFDQLVGFITVAQEQTRRGGEVIGTALRTIFTRLFRTPSLEVLQELGIATRTATGEFRTASDIIADLAVKFKDLNDGQKLSVASTIAGQRQISTLLAVLNNFDRAVDATNTSINSQGTAAELTRIRQEALQVQLQKVSNQFLSFAAAAGQAFAPDIIEFISQIGDAFESLGSVVGVLGSTFTGNFLQALTKVAAGLAVGQLGIGNLNSFLSGLTERLFGASKAATQTAQAVQSVGQASSQAVVSSAGRKPRNESERDALQLEEARKVLLDLQNKARAQAAELEAGLLKTEALQIRLKSEGVNLDKELVTLKITQSELDKINTAEKKNVNKLTKENNKITKTAFELEKEGILINKEILELNNEVRKAKENIITNDISQHIIANEIIAFEKKREKLNKELARQVKAGNVDAGETKVKIEQINNAIRERLPLIREEAILTKARLDAKIAALELKVTKLIEARVSRLARQKEINLEIAKIQEEAADKRLNLDNRIDASTRRISEIQKETALIDKEIADSNARLVTEKEKLLTLTGQIGNAQKTVSDAEKKAAISAEKQANKVVTGFKGFGVGLGVSFLFDAAAESVEKFASDGEKRLNTFGRVTQSTLKGIGDTLQTLFIFGKNPIGLLLTGLSALRGVINVIRSFGTDLKGILKDVTEEGDNLRQSIRGIETTFQPLLTLAEDFRKEEFSTEQFKQLDEALKDLGDTFKNITSKEIADFSLSIRRAVTEGDINKVKELRSELERTAILERIRSGELLNVKNIEDARKVIKDSNDELTFLNKKLDEVRKAPNIAFFRKEDLEESIDKVNKELSSANDIIVEFGRNAFIALNSTIVPSKTLSQNLNDLSFEAKNAVEQAGLLPEALNLLATKQGLQTSASVIGIIKNQTAEEASLVDILNSKFSETGDSLLKVRSILNNINGIGNQTAEIAFSINEAFLNTSEGTKFIEALSKATGRSGQELTKLIGTIAGKGTKGFKLLSLETGELLLSIDGVNKQIIINDAKTKELLSTVQKFATVVGVNTENQKTLGVSLLSNDKILTILQQRFTGIVDRVDRTTKSIGELSSTLSEIRKLDDIIKTAFPENSFAALDSGFDLLLEKIEKNNIAGNGLIDVFERINEVNGAMAVGLSDTLRQSLDIATQSFDVLSARVNLADSAFEKIEAGLTSFTAAAKEASSIGGLSALGQEAEEIAKQTLLVEKVSTSLLGLAAVRDKFRATAGKPILEEDIAAVDKFQDRLSDLFNLDNVRINIKPGQLGGQEVAGQIEDFLRNISGAIRSNLDPIARESVLSLTKNIISQIEAAASEGGDVIIRDIESILTEPLNRFDEKIRPIIQQLKDSFLGLANANEDALNKIFEDTDAILSSVAESISKRQFIPNLDNAANRNNFLKLFERVNRAVEIQVNNIKKQISGIDTNLKSLQARRDALLGPNGTPTLGAEQKFADISNEINAIFEKRRELNVQLNAERKKELAISARFQNIIGAAIEGLNSAVKDLLSNQKALVDNEVEAARVRLSFLEEENTTFESKIALAQIEREQVDAIFAGVSRLNDVNISEVGDRLVKLTTEQLQGTDVGGSVIQKEINEQEIDALQDTLARTKELNQLRISSLQKELELVKQQKDAINDLAISFLKSNKEQQSQIINAARLTESFFGNLTDESLNSRTFQTTLSNFIRNTTDTQREAVIGQLERVRAAGGSIGGGVAAADVLRAIGDAVGAAIFKSPQQAALDRQTELQSRIVDLSTDNLQISEIQTRIAEAQVNLLSEIARTFVAIGGTSPEVGAGINNRVNAIRDTVLGATERTSEITRKRLATEKELQKEVTNTAFNNRNFVKALKDVDLASIDAGLSVEDFQSKMVELRDALITAEDRVIDAEESFNSALGGVASALVEGASAQAEYNLAIIEASIQNDRAVGAFATFRNELGAIRTAFESQISALQTIKNTEQEVAEIRVRLAQQELEVFDRIISDLESRAEQALTASPADIARQSEFAQAGTTIANIFRQAGITPENFRSTSSEVLNQLGDFILNLDQRFRENIAGAFSNLPPGRTFEGFSAEQLRQITLASVAGGDELTPTLLDLEKEAAERRKIIAENSTAQLETSRQSLSSSLEQLASAQESLNEARAQRDLAKLQLETFQNGFIETADTISTAIADNITNLSTLQEVSFAEVSNNLRSIDSHIVELNRAGLAFGVDIPGITTNAAGGTLSAAEMRGLLIAASKEKRMMPNGARLGIFNTSETVLTKGQMSKLRVAKGGVPNAQDGFGSIAIDNNEVIALLGNIATRLTELKQAGLTQNVQVDINTNRRVSVEGLAGLQTALQDIITDRTQDLFTREEALAVQQMVQTILNKLRATNQITAIGT